MTKIELNDKRLRPATDDDAEIVWQWRNHPEIRKWMFSQNEIKLDNHKKWFSEKLASPDNFFLIYEINNNKQGFVSFNKLNSANVWEWGFYLSPESPKGIGGCMGKLAIQYAFDVIHAEKLFGEVLEYNLRSVKFHEKLGFYKEGCLRKHFKLNGQYHNILLFGLLKKEHKGLGN